MAVSPEEIDAWIGAHRDALLACASSIVQVPSESKPPTGEELACQRLIRGLLADSGAEVDWFTPDDVPGLREHSVFFPMVAGMERQFAKLYGRGADDTKAALASYIFAVRCLRALGVRLRGDVLVESVCDEEWGGSHGVLAARLRGHTADVAINTEPTGLAVCPEHRGGRDMYLVMRGTAQFAAAEAGVNAIGTLARTVLAVEEFERERNARTPTPPLFRDNPGLPIYLDQVRGGGSNYFEAMDPPLECSLHVWAETYAGTTAEEFDSALMEAITRRLQADPTFHGPLPELQPTIRYLPGSAISLDHPIFAALQAAYRTVPERPYTVRGAPFACDAYTDDSRKCRVSLAG